MADNKKNQDGRDDSKIDSNDASEVQYEAKKLGVTPKQIRDAITEVGNSRSAVEKYLRK
jgi:hypothetical protein